MSLDIQNVSDSNSEKSESKITKKIKKPKIKLADESSFSKMKIRIIFAIILSVVLIVYLFSAMAYSFGVTQIKTATWLDVFAYIHLLISLLILGGATFEISHIFGFRKVYEHTIFIICSTVLYYLPITVANSYYPAWIFVNWAPSFERYMTLIWFVGLTIVSLITILMFTKNKNFNPRNIFYFIGYLTIVIFGLKGITALSLTPVNVISEQIFGGHSGATIIWIWVMAIVSDTVAYFVGVKWGKTKLAPEISPKKSIEGAIGGFAAAFVFGVVFAMILLFAIPNNHNFIPFKGFIGESEVWAKILIVILFSIIVPILSIAGDLFFSILKRKFDVKDYSNLLPGHGGVLDRLDSILFTAFIMEIIILLLTI
ncbi:phosphatidate cytidylyltransferase [Spiroplasma endosymbiont of Othius punctulatus]|uniref:phosphatidate cytidylyltransferase n=1 Tax=Spiroplasma endosymbiont of Othius punctulatus TaxID=3066289 RepID=UPI0030D2330D